MRSTPALHGELTVCGCLLHSAIPLASLVLLKGLPPLSTHGMYGDGNQQAYEPNDSERVWYYYGVAGSKPSDTPSLLYRSTYAEPYALPGDSWDMPQAKQVFGASDHKLAQHWDVLVLAVGALLDNHGVAWQSIDPVRFSTTTWRGEVDAVGAPVVWVCVRPGSTTSALAHALSQHILIILHRMGLDDVAVEWREAIVARLSAPMLDPLDDWNPTFQERHFLTPHLGVPIASQAGDFEDAQGTLTLWFGDGERVLGLSNRHVLLDTGTNEYQDGVDVAIRVCGDRHFEAGMDAIRTAEAYNDEDRKMRAERVDNLVLFGDPRGRLEKETDHIATLDYKARELARLHEEAKRDWGTKEKRTIGRLEYAAPAGIDPSTYHTVDWATFVVDAERVRPHFAGNTINLGMSRLLCCDCYILTCRPQVHTRRA